MKKAVAFLLVVIVSSGCATKLEQARTNITQTWRISKVFKNGADITANYISTHEDYRISFDNNAGFVESYYPFSGSPQVTVNGSWEFIDGITKLNLTDNNQTRLFRIDQLDEDNFNIANLSANDDTEFQFIPD